MSRERKFIGWIRRGDDYSVRVENRASSPTEIGFAHGQTRTDGSPEAPTVAISPGATETDSATIDDHPAVRTVEFVLTVPEGCQGEIVVRWPDANGQGDQGVIRSLQDNLWLKVRRS